MVLMFVMLLWGKVGMESVKVKKTNDALLEGLRGATWGRMAFQH